MTETDSTTIRIYNEDAKVWREFLQRTHSEGTQTFHEFMVQLRLLLDLMGQNKKLLYMFEMNHVRSNRWVILRLSDGLASNWDEIPNELKADILKGFRYDSKFHDLVPAEEEEKKEGEQ